MYIRITGWAGYPASQHSFAEKYELVLQMQSRQSYEPVLLQGWILVEFRSRKFLYNILKWKTNFRRKFRGGLSFWFVIWGILWKKNPKGSDIWSLIQRFLWKLSLFLALIAYKRPNTGLGLLRWQFLNRCCISSPILFYNLHPMIITCIHRITNYWKHICSRQCRLQV